MPIPDVLKSWDVSHALDAIERAGIERSAPVLDMGCYNSEIIYVLHALGYRQIHGCDLNPLCRRLPYWHRVHYRIADLTDTHFPDQFFAAITCLSVIEHGVPLDGLAREVARLLRPGGIFVLTTDYDGTGERHVIAGDVRPFGLDWQVYTEDGFQRVIGVLEQAGLRLLQPEIVPLTHTERPIIWNQHSYTFVLAVLRAPRQ